MRKLRILKKILVQTKAMNILIGFLTFLFIDAFVILLAEPGIETYADALWFFYAVLSTIGFGDVLAVTLIGRVGAVLLTIYALLAFAIITGVVVNFYTQIIEIQQKDTVASFVDKLENLPNLTKEELEDLSKRAKTFHKNILKDK